jgi:hypothetical protein
LTPKPENGDYPDSALYFYSRKFQDIDYSFSKKLDSLNKAKLYRMKLIYRERYYSEYKKTIPARVMELKFVRVDSIENYDAINNIFEAFEKLKL